MALHDAQAAGTACVCLCIGGGATAEQLEQVFGSANVLMVDDADQWISRIGEVFKDALSNVRMGRQRTTRNTPSRRQSAPINGPVNSQGFIASISSDGAIQI
ncbi:MULTISPECIES: hypothetical protein [Pseudomonas fluorescens group]|uniref:Uncharacterized protein n=1 Tax=Pseudomonas kilonensis TaxID=132476 RepID=A0A0F4XVP6_9PSED|nr:MULTISPECIES: hypothetical protein [Pseudomonas fluorescens group]KKA09999.1 hypothetical protein VP02_01245 [Pseudomonas ogarae]WGT27993.1 hypothetical protein QGQ83_30755 [Pseudomonas marginalis]